MLSSWIYMNHSNCRWLLRYKNNQSCKQSQDTVPAGNCMFKINNRNTTTRCEICSKSTIKTPERRRRIVFYRTPAVTVSTFGGLHIILSNTLQSGIKNKLWLSCACVKEGLQKQSLGVILPKCFSGGFWKIHIKTPAPVSFLTKLLAMGLQLFQKETDTSVFMWIVWNFLNSFFINTCKNWLLLRLQALRCLNSIFFSQWDIHTSISNSWNMSLL